MNTSGATKVTSPSALASPVASGSPVGQLGPPGPLAQHITLVKPLLDVRALTKRFGGLVAVHEVNFTVEPKRIVSVIGPNGAGKTTLFNMVAGFYSPTSGAIYFNDRPIHKLAPHQITARGIARTFQNIRLFTNLTVLENVLVGMHPRLRSSAVGAVLRTPWFVREERSARQKAMDLLALLQLDQYATELAANLPYGMQRRLEIARALASDPQLLLLDEPTAGMNPHETAAMMLLIRRLRDELGLAILLIEHDMKLVMGISERVSVLNYGEKIAEGTPEEVQANPQVVEAYLGRRHQTEAPAAAGPSDPATSESAQGATAQGATARASGAPSATETMSGSEPAAPGGSAEPGS